MLVGIKIPVHRGQEVVGHAIISPIDVALGRYKWNTTPDGYVYRTTRLGGRAGTNRRVYIHREIMGLTFGQPLEVDHVDRQPWNNRRDNLEIVTRGENLRRRNTEYPIRTK